MNDYRFIRTYEGKYYVLNHDFPIVQVQDEEAAKREVKRLKEQDMAEKIKLDFSQ